MGEWNDDLPPSQVGLGQMSRDHLSQPDDVPDLLLLQLDVRVENGHLVALVECQRIPPALFVVHYVV